jgi:hypothetical protein
VVEADVPLAACDNPDLHYQFGVDMFIAVGRRPPGEVDGRQYPADPAQDGGELLR